ncbi:MAG: shikimate kinase [bacterium]|jgi:shikimate kinase|nr:shikimate kinase [bacterium]
MNLILIGYRGTGKSTLAEMLHHQLDRPVYHMDAILEQRFGESISAFVEKLGWDAFRQAETALALELAQKDNVIIDCGGGVVTRAINMQHLKPTGYVVWLKTAPAIIAQRIGQDTNRPSLSGTASHTEEILEILNQRMPLYEAAADLTVDTDTHSHDECVQIILNAWKDYHETLETS